MIEDPSLWFDSLMLFITQFLATISEVDIED